MLLKAGQTVTVDELLRGLIVRFGQRRGDHAGRVNIAGSEAGFVDMMNQEAKRLGMKNTHFANPAGLPDAEHYSTASDLAVLAAAMIRDYPAVLSAVLAAQLHVQQRHAVQSQPAAVDRSLCGRHQNRVHRIGRVLPGRVGTAR